MSDLAGAAGDKEWRQRQKQPLKSPKHVFTYEEGKMTYCGDHYCTGHSNIEMKCSCGWSAKVDSSYNIKNEAAQIKHVLQAEGLM